ncbi:hypothetical protein KC326_g205 [Hortaea werneckii]|nr:hypothetical protein KC326_g205 [Hortaea werneckii]
MNKRESFEIVALADLSYLTKTSIGEGDLLPVPTATGLWKSGVSLLFIKRLGRRVIFGPHRSRRSLYLTSGS